MQMLSRDSTRPENNKKSLNKNGNTFCCELLYYAYLLSLTITYLLYLLTITPVKQRQQGKNDTLFKDGDPRKPDPIRRHIPIEPKYESKPLPQGVYVTQQFTKNTSIADRRLGLLISTAPAMKK